VAIERDREAAAHARAALGDRGGVIRGAVEDHLAAALPADAVIVNPPRSGLHTQVCEALERASPRPRLIVYVSCDPATLGRDVTRLPSYVMRSAVPFDMFPQTAHVETVGSLAPVGT
jgi:23S rRNA (uracil1939-C5)-methyltransferase